MVKRFIIFIILCLSFYTEVLTAQEYSSTGRTELQIGQTLNGIALGVASFSFIDNYFLIGPVVAGTGVLGSQYPKWINKEMHINTGTAQFINFSSIWGTTMALSMSSMFDLRWRGIASLAFISNILSTGSSIQYAKTNGAITRGDNGRFISGNIYGIASVWLIATSPLFSQGFSDSKHAATILSFGHIVGLAAGATMMNSLDWSRERTLLVDLSVVAGFGFGFGVSHLADLPYTLKWFTSVSMALVGAYISIQKSRGMASDESQPKINSEKVMSFSIPGFSYSY